MSKKRSVIDHIGCGAFRTNSNVNEKYRIKAEMMRFRNIILIPIILATKNSL